MKLSFRNFAVVVVFAAATASVTQAQETRPSCSTSADCPVLEDATVAVPSFYCASDKTCVATGDCVSVDDCSAIDNVYPTTMQLMSTMHCIEDAGSPGKCVNINDDAPASCSSPDFPACGALEGDCCPNEDGKYLACCAGITVAPTTVPESWTMEASCAAHPQCVAMGLTSETGGETQCCPDDDGEMLECCSTTPPPPQPMPENGNPVVMPSDPNAANPGNPAIMPSDPNANPGNPVVMPSDPATDSGNPVVMPSDPATDPGNPVTMPVDPADPGNPVTMPADPTDPGNPVVMPSDPADPGNPVVMPSDPADSAGPVVMPIPLPEEGNSTVSCASDDDCDVDIAEYCAQGMCMMQGTCMADSDCFNPANFMWADPKCKGKLHCMEGYCHRDCGVPECESLKEEPMCTITGCDRKIACPGSVNCVLDPCSESCDGMYFDAAGNVISDCGGGSTSMEGETAAPMPSDATTTATTTATDTTMTSTDNGPSSPAISVMSSEGSSSYYGFVLVNAMLVGVVGAASLF